MIRVLLRSSATRLSLCPQCACPLPLSFLRLRSVPLASHRAKSGATRSPGTHLQEPLTWKQLETASLPDLSVYYLRLSKYRLTSLVVATTLAGFVMGCPTWSMDTTVLAATLTGTALTSAAAASLNQFLEVPFDSQMARTRSRPLVMGQLSQLHAFSFAVSSGAVGLSLLFFGTNALTAALGAANLVLYSFIYTPMKRMNISNTWIGSFVGAIPPVMGYTAATGSLTLSGLLLGAILYSWQFPHFNALSWNLRHDYARAGYRMMSVTDPALCLRTQMRHSLLLTSYCLLMSHPSVGLTTWTFAVDTLPFNLYLVYLSFKFKSDPSSSTSRTLFRYSLLHLPAVILLMLLSKNSKSGADDDDTDGHLSSSIKLEAS